MKTKQVLIQRPFFLRKVHLYIFPSYTFLIKPCFLPIALLALVSFSFHVCLQKQHLNCDGNLNQESCLFLLHTATPNDGSGFEVVTSEWFQQVLKRHMTSIAELRGIDNTQRFTERGPYMVVLNMVLCTLLLKTHKYFIFGLQGLQTRYAN